MNQVKTIAIVGLGYVGLPLALAFGRHFRTIGYDLSEIKISDYRRKIDRTGEIAPEEFDFAEQLEFHSDPGAIAEADFVIISVPTPVDGAHVPDLRPLQNASITVGQHLKAGAIVVFESTVFPGATEEICVPLLERESGYKHLTDFFVGYSPERINPGDKEHTLTRILKVVSGDTAETLDCVAEIYKTVVEAGVYKAPSIRIAEAAKVIENTQRDLNIALMNELSIIFNRLGIDTNEVLKAASTKWNFLSFKPGLVGGHCIGVDPYYLTYKAEQVGYHPQVILAGRRINDTMPEHIALQIAKILGRTGANFESRVIVIFGVTFKENCSDVRNSKVAELVKELCGFGFKVFVSDPLADSEEVMREYGIRLTDWPSLPQADALVLAVPHKNFLEMNVVSMLKSLKPGGLVVDVKSALDPVSVRDYGFQMWRL